MRASNPEIVSSDFYALVCGHDPWQASYIGCIVIGIRFHIKQHEVHLGSQNSGMLVTGKHLSNLLEFYSILYDILEFQFMGWRRVYLF